MTQSTLSTVNKEGELTYSPFKNLAEDRIRNACRSSEATQRNYFATADVAHAICLWYWASRFGDTLILDLAGRSIDRTEAISLLKTFCHRESSIASLNLERSRYAAAKNRVPSVYGVAVASSLGRICASLAVEQRNC